MLGCIQLHIFGSGLLLLLAQYRDALPFGTTIFAESRAAASNGAFSLGFDIGV